MVVEGKADIVAARALAPGIDGRFSRSGAKVPAGF
jgi:hypothetical protein